jgi:hypothetical protein
MYLYGNRYREKTMTIFLVLIVAVIGPLLIRFSGLLAGALVWAISLPLILVWFLFRSFFPKTKKVKV